MVTSPSRDTKNPGSFGSKPRDYTAVEDTSSLLTTLRYPDPFQASESASFVPVDSGDAGAVAVQVLYHLLEFKPWHVSLDRES